MIFDQVGNSCENFFYKIHIYFNLLTGYDEIFRKQDIYSLYLKTSEKIFPGF